MSHAPASLKFFFRIYGDRTTQQGRSLPNSHDWQRDREATGPNHFEKEVYLNTNRARRCARSMPTLELRLIMRLGAPPVFLGRESDQTMVGGAVESALRAVRQPGDIVGRQQVRLLREVLRRLDGGVDEL